MIPVAAPSKTPARSALSLGETLLHMVLCAAVPISAVLFVALSF